MSTTSTEAAAVAATPTTGAYDFHNPTSHQTVQLHNIAEPQWLPRSVHQTIQNESNLDRIERDEEMYLEQLRSSSLVYRPPPSSSSSDNMNSSDHYNHSNSYGFPVVGVSSSSKLMSDILLQFHQEAESIDLLGFNAIREDDMNTATGGGNQSGGDDSFFQKHRSQFQELFLQHQQQNHSITSLNSKTNKNKPENSPSESAVKNNSNMEQGDDDDNVSYSSSMMMMSMNSSCTTNLMSP